MNDESPLTPEQIKALFKEWTADFATAKVRDGKAATLEDILSSQAVDIPKPTTDKQQDREGGIER